MDRSFKERNQSATAKRKIKSLAKVSNVPEDIVTALANFTWDYDPMFRNEAIGWVKNNDLGNAAEGQLQRIAEIALEGPTRWVAAASGNKRHDQEHEVWRHAAAGAHHPVTCGRSGHGSIREGGAMMAAEAAQGNRTPTPRPR
jgi:hypothetical protein